MKLKYAVPVILLLVLLAGCGAGRNQTASPTESAAQNTDAVTSETPTPGQTHPFVDDDALDQTAVMEAYRKSPQDTAQRMAQFYIDAIKKGLDLSKDDEGIAQFELLFDRQTLAARNLRPAENMPDSYQCDLEGSGPNGERRMPLLIIFQDDDPRFFCPLTRYGKQSRTMLEVYLGCLKAADARMLSEWLAIDGPSAEFLEDANRLIAHYSQYDLSNAEIVNFDYDSEIDRFVYRIQAGKEEFKILMVYGDGFCMPDINSLE